MKTNAVVLILLVTILFAFGCSETDGPQQSVMPSNEAVVIDGMQRALALEPGGYYSFHSGLIYSELEQISKVDGTATYIWSGGFEVVGDFVTWLGWGPFGLCFDLDGTMYATQSIISFDPSQVRSQLVRMDAATGAVTTIGDPVPFNTTGPEVDACGNMFATGFQVDALGYIWGNSSLWRIDKNTGEFIEVGNTGHTNWMDIAFDSEGTLWGTFDNELYTIDTATGASTFITHIEGVPNAGDPDRMEVMSIAFDKHDVLYATAMTVYYEDPNGSPVLRIDTNTGQAELIGYTQKPYNHGGDIMPEMVTVCHRKGNGDYVTISVQLNALAAHRAHGDVVPGVDTEGCGCPGAGPNITTE